MNQRAKERKNLNEPLSDCIYKMASSLKNESESIDIYLLNPLFKSFEYSYINILKILIRYEIMENSTSGYGVVVCYSYTNSINLRSKPEAEFSKISIYKYM
jgi:hypothetical protein